MAINHIGDRKHLTLDDRIRIETLIEHRARMRRNVAIIFCVMDFSFRRSLRNCPNFSLSIWYICLHLLRLFYPSYGTEGNLPAGELCILYQFASS